MVVRAGGCAHSRPSMVAPWVVAFSKTRILGDEKPNIRYDKPEYERFYTEIRFFFFIYDSRIGTYTLTDAPVHHRPPSRDFTSIRQRIRTDT